MVGTPAMASHVMNMIKIAGPQCPLSCTLADSFMSWLVLFLIYFSFLSAHRFFLKCGQLTIHSPQTEPRPMCW